jgi:S-DNA-T family DNA segregation ATPase FtsK/SpoIIIE
VILLVSLWGAPPWTWAGRKRGKKKASGEEPAWRVLAFLGRLFSGIRKRLGARFGRKPASPGPAHAGGEAGGDGGWTPPIGGAWTAGLAPPRNDAGAPSAADEPEESAFLPLPAPEPDLPLDPDLLPDPPPEDPSLSALDASLPALESEIVEVVESTTRVKLVPTGTPPARGLSNVRFEFGKEEGNPIPVTKIEKALKDLGLRTRRSPVRVEVTDAIRFELPLKGSERSFAPIRPLLLETAPASPDAPLTYLIGRRHDTTPFELEMKEARHMLVGGTTGGGKTVLLHTLIFGLAFRYPPSRVRLALFDPKMLEFSRYRGLPHLWQEVVTTPEGFYQLVENLHAELQRRKRVRVEDPQASFPALVTVVDEFSGYNTDKLVRLIAEARALDMYFVLATQHPTANVISTSIKANLVTGIAFRVKASTGSHLVIGTGDAVKLTGKGDCLVQAPSGLQRVQAGWVRDADFEALGGFLAGEPDED